MEEWNIPPCSLLTKVLPLLSSGMLYLEHAVMWRMEWGPGSALALGVVHLGTAAPSLKPLSLQSPPACSAGSIPVGNVLLCALQIAHSPHR